MARKICHEKRWRQHPADVPVATFYQNNIWLKERAGLRCCSCRLGYCSGVIVIKNPVTAAILFSLFFAASASLAAETPETTSVESPVADENARSQTIDGLKTEEKSTFEFGVAAAALQVPAYPSSSVKNDRFFGACLLYTSPSPRDS